MTNPAFDRFKNAFPQTTHFPVIAQQMETRIAAEFGIPSPKLLLEFWNTFGCGYFGKKELYFFGTGEDNARDSLIDWNKKDFWKDVMPAWNQGRPLFFAETCFGEQIGFRFVNKIVRAVLYIVDTNEIFVLSDNFDELYTNILSTSDGVTDPHRLNTVQQRLGALPFGSHYAPIDSPLVGGSGEASNFSIQTPNTHFRTAIATYLAIKNRHK